MRVSDKTEIENITGFHTKNHSNSDVQGIHFKEKIMPYLLSGISNYFENLLGLNVESSFLREITQTDIKEFPKLKFLYLENNHITYLEKNVFEFNPDLEYINLNLNSIKTIHSEVFNNLKRLQFISLAKNECIDVQASGDEQIAELIHKILISCKRIPELDIDLLDQKATLLVPKSEFPIITILTVSALVIVIFIIAAIYFRCRYFSS